MDDLVPLFQNVETAFHGNYQIAEAGGQQPVVLLIPLRHSVAKTRQNRREAVLMAHIDRVTLNQIRELTWYLHNRKAENLKRKHTDPLHEYTGQGPGLL